MIFFALFLIEAAVAGMLMELQDSFFFDPGLKHLMISKESPVLNPGAA